MDGCPCPDEDLHQAPTWISRRDSLSGQANIDALQSFVTNHPAAMLARARGIRLVTTSASSDPDSSWVAIDDFGAGVMVGEHLANLVTATLLSSSRRTNRRQPRAAPRRSRTELP